MPASPRRPMRAINVSATSPLRRWSNAISAIFTVPTSLLLSATAGSRTRTELSWNSHICRTLTAAMFYPIQTRYRIPGDRRVLPRCLHLRNPSPDPWSKNASVDEPPIHRWPNRFQLKKYERLFHGTAYTWWPRRPIRFGEFGGDFFNSSVRFAGWQRRRTTSRLRGTRVASPSSWTRILWPRIRLLGWVGLRRIRLRELGLILAISSWKQLLTIANWINAYSNTETVELEIGHNPHGIPRQVGWELDLFQRAEDQESENGSLFETKKRGFAVERWKKPRRLRSPQNPWVFQNHSEAEFRRWLSDQFLSYL